MFWLLWLWKGWNTIKVTPSSGRTTILEEEIEFSNTWILSGAKDTQNRPIQKLLSDSENQYRFLNRWCLFRGGADV